MSSTEENIYTKLGQMSDQALLVLTNQVQIELARRLLTRLPPRPSAGLSATETGAE